MKEITFVNNYQLVSKDVDLDKLSRTARLLAEIVFTTENCDDLSNVRVKSPRTNREIYLAEMVFEEELARVEKAFPSYLDEYPSILWRWDVLKNWETPEAYFERHARMIQKTGGEIIAA